MDRPDRRLGAEGPLGLEDARAQFGLADARVQLGLEDARVQLGRVVAHVQTGPRASSASLLRLGRSTQVRALSLAAAAPAGPLRLRLWADGGGRPGALLHDLRLPARPEGAQAAWALHLGLLGGITYWAELSVDGVALPQWRLHGAAPRSPAAVLRAWLQSSGLSPQRRAWG